jgi:hypothetical protein
VLRSKGACINRECYEKGYARGAKIQSVDFDGHVLAQNPVGSSPRGFVVSAVSTPTYARPNILSILRSPHSVPLTAFDFQPRTLTFAPAALGCAPRILRFSVPFSEDAVNAQLVNSARHPDRSSGRYRPKPGNYARRKRNTRQRNRP